MDKIKFAVLIAYIQSNVINGNLREYEISEIDRQINEGVQKLTVNVETLHMLLDAIRTNRKIGAIKAHHALTGFGLKESKDAVEKYGFGVADLS